MKLLDITFYLMCTLSIIDGIKRIFEMAALYANQYQGLIAVVFLAITTMYKITNEKAKRKILDSEQKERDFIDKTLK